jgi:hypothetical protein
MSGVAIAGLVVAVVSAAVSVGVSVDAKNKQKSAQRRAEAEADKALEAARKTMEMRKLATLAINEKPFRTASENLATVAATGIQVAKGGDPRQLASVIGRTQMANIAEQEYVQSQQSSRLDQLELLKAQEEQEIRDNIAGTYTAEAEGAQMAAADAAKLAAQYESEAIQAGVAGAGSIAQQGIAVGGAAKSNNAAQLKTNIDADISSGKSLSQIGKDIGGKFSDKIDPNLYQEYVTDVSAAKSSAALMDVFNKYGVNASSINTGYYEQ